MRKEAADIRKLKKYKPTRFMAEGSTYNRELADLAVSFIGCLKHTKGEWYGQNFELIDWQEQIIRDLFGIVKPNGYRQFNTAYIEIAKKQGKSELAAAVALLLTCGDMEYGGEVYGCASDRQQASIVFDVACGMVEQCPALKSRIKPVLSFTGMSSEPTMDEADRIASYVMDGFVEGKIDRVMIYYQHAKNRVDQEQVIEQVLPIETEELILPNEPRNPEAVSHVGRDYSSNFEFEPSATEVLGYLAPAYIRTIIFHALLDSAAAEHGARRRAMQSATDNAQEVITNLSRTYNRVRQSSITTELNEIIGGASALEDN